MTKKELEVQLTAELERTYHNATLHSKLYGESDYECDLIQSQVEIECEAAIADLKYTCPAILKHGKVYQWGRGGRTLAPEYIIETRGGGSFRIKDLDSLDLDYESGLELLKDLTEFNNEVESFCKHVTDSAIECIREEYSAEIEENKNKTRQQYSGVRYV